MSSPAFAKEIEFIRAAGRPCMEQWSEASIREYLGFHADQGTLMVLGRNLEICGLSVVWLGKEGSLEEYWAPNDKHGDSAYVAHWIATDRAASRLMSKVWRETIPQWTRLKIYMRRAHRGLVPVPHRLWEKFIR